MALDNYRDLSVAGSDINAGFQFEFTCAVCGRKWKSPFKPYRLGQVTGLLTRFMFLFSGNSSVKTAGRASGNFADMGSRGAKEGALAEAMQQAERLYQTCDGCKKGVCADCFDSREDRCIACVKNTATDAQTAARRAADAVRERSAHACPNCGTDNSAGGRFCAECGFDMASTHKSCPACSAMLPRQARFCTDCGHAF